MRWCVGPCPGDYWRDECIIVASNVTLRYYYYSHDNYQHPTNNKPLVVDKRLLEDAVVAEFQQVLEAAVRRSKQEGNHLKAELRSPLAVATTLQLIFHGVKAPLGVVEQEMLQDCFWNDYELPLLAINSNSDNNSQNVSFQLRHVGVALNVMTEKHDDRRRLHLRYNSHGHARLRVDLFVQASCSGLACQSQGFKETLQQLMESRRNDFVKTLQRKGHFTAHNDYFEDITYIQVLGPSNEWSPLPDDYHGLILHYYPPSDEEYVLPYWFWIGVTITLLLLAGAAICLFVLGKQNYDSKKKKAARAQALLASTSEESGAFEATSDSCRVEPLVVLTKKQGARVEADASRPPSPRKTSPRKVVPIVVPAVGNKETAQKSSPRKSADMVVPSSPSRARTSPAKSPKKVQETRSPSPTKKHGSPTKGPTTKSLSPRKRYGKVAPLVIVSEGRRIIET